MLQIRSESAFEAHVAVEAAGSERLVAAASLWVDGLVATLTLNSLIRPKQEFYNFTI
jgi:hypothetical protein